MEDFTHYNEKKYNIDQSNRFLMRIVRGSVFGVVLFIGLLMYGCPKYSVWTSEVAIKEMENNGRAAMAEAEENRKIQIEEAKANLEAQKLNSLAEVERARGMAKAIEIENGKLTSMYIHYLWVRNIDKMDGDKIYIPTEANMPILEAAK